MSAKRWWLVACVLFVIGFTQPTPFSYAQTPESKTFTSCDGRLSFDYPAAWLVQESQAIFPNLASEDGSNESLPSVRWYYPAEDFLGENWTTPGYFDFSVALQIPWGLGDDRPTPLEQLSGDITVIGADRTYGAPIEMTVQDWLAARRDYVGTNDGLAIVGFQMIIAISDKYDLRIHAEADANEMMALEDNLQLFLDSLVYTDNGPNTPPMGWFLYFKDTCAFRFFYPQNWIISEAASNKILLSNSQDAADKKMRRRPFDADELEITIVPPAEIANYFYGTLDPTQATSEEILSAYVQIEELPAEFPTQVTIGEWEVLRAEMPSGFILLFDFGDGQYAIFAARSGSGGLSEFETAIMQVVESLRYEPPQEAPEEPTQTP
ncbi:MAG: hypothetical protein DPW16_15005 [Chloroflexi bacterium]|nr:hypothetical protein [Chloroflexota bacterium]